MVENVLREMNELNISNEALLRMFPLQNALTHYELALGNILDLLRVRPL